MNPAVGVKFPPACLEPREKNNACTMFWGNDHVVQISCRLITLESIRMLLFTVWNFVDTRKRVISTEDNLLGNHIM